MVAEDIQWINILRLDVIAIHGRRESKPLKIHPTAANHHPLTDS